jgi:hypothetical protein
MHTTNGRSGIQADDCRLLAALMETEDRHYRRLLRLAWRQNSYMKRQDVDRLESNAMDWSRHLPEADQSRIARERYVAEMARRIGLSIPPGRVSDLLDYTDPATRREVTAAMKSLRRTAGRLARQNELNRNLAEFCLDLAHEESQIFKKCVLEDPTGCYGDDAKATDRGPGGFLVKQA